MLAGARESFIKTFFISEIDFACLELTCNVGFFQWWAGVARSCIVVIYLLLVPPRGHLFDLLEVRDMISSQVLFTIGIPPMMFIHGPKYPELSNEINIAALYLTFKS